MADGGQIIRARDYWAAIRRQAWSDLRRWIGAHLAFGGALVLATLVVGALFGAAVDGKTMTGLLLIPLAALGCVALVVYLAAFVRAPLAIARRAASQAAQQEARAIASAVEAERAGVASERKEPISQEHRGMLQNVALELLPGLQISEQAFYGQQGDEHKARSFREHFPDIAQGITEWNEQIEAIEQSAESLRGGRRRGLRCSRTTSRRTGAAWRGPLWLRLRLTTQHWNSTPSPASFSSGYIR